MDEIGELIEKLLYKKNCRHYNVKNKKWMFWCYNIVFTLILSDVRIIIYCCKFAFEKWKRETFWKYGGSIYVLFWETLKIRIRFEEENLFTFSFCLFSYNRDVLVFELECFKSVKMQNLISFGKLNLEYNKLM